MKRIWSIVAAGVALSLGAAHAADDLTAWLADRQAKFAQYNAEHPNLEREIAALKAKAGTVSPSGPYAELRERSGRLTPVQRMEALNYFKNGFDLWKAGDFQAAELAFRRGLDIDPANGVASFYYADCLRRRGDNAGAHEHYRRAAALGQGSAEALKAEVALKSLSPDTAEAAPPPPIIRRIPGAVTEIWECPECPRLTVIPPGEYSMWQGEQAKGWPLRRVTIPRPFAAGTFEVTRAEYGRFAAETGRAWTPPKFDQSPDHPVVNVAWDDAKAYVAWLSGKTGKTYRLLSESEWEYAARAGSTARFPWGDSIDRSRANYGKDDSNGGFAAGADRWIYTAPVGQFPANGFGIFDVIGNVGELVEDCWQADGMTTEVFDGMPTDGRAWTAGDCTWAWRVLCGGGWWDKSGSHGSALHQGFPSGILSPSAGFRVARNL